MHGSGVISDDTRIQEAIPTIEYLLENGASIILCSHLGRPNGRIDEDLRLKPIAERLATLLDKEIRYTSDEENQTLNISSIRQGEVVLLENIRFSSQEETNDEPFAMSLAKMADVFVNDAFGTAHRAHASTTTISTFFKDKFFGKCLEREVNSIKKVLISGEKPILAILGGAKISSKIPILKNIIKIADHIIVGGGMSFTFIKAMGGQIGLSIHEDSMLDTAKEIIEKAEKNNVKIHLPIDVVCSKDFDNESEQKIFDITKIDNDFQGMDAGPKSLDLFEKVIMDSKTILWNGPLGVFEFDSFARGTIKLGEFISEATLKGSFSLVGGGDSVAAVKKFGFFKKMSYVSTGGGAMLESLEGRDLPGIKALED